MARDRCRLLADGVLIAVMVSTVCQAQQAHAHAQHASPPGEQEVHTGHGDHSTHGHSAHGASAHGMHAPGPDSASQHVPPDPPRHVMAELPHARMVELMGMNDAAPYWLVTIERLEWQGARAHDALAWDVDAYYGNDYHKAWLKYAGARVVGKHEVRGELLWDRIFARWWSTQFGVRHDTGEGASRTWLAAGVQGLAPYWFEVAATAYLGEQGRTALSVEVERDLLLTQRLILQPAIEAHIYGKNDPANAIGAGIATLEASLRLRYEIRREFAPYVGVEWTRLYGKTAAWARAAGEDASEVRAVAGLRAWF